MPKRNCETCVHYREPGIDFNAITGKYYRSKWHRCARLMVVVDREQPGRERGHILPIEATKTLAWMASATALHVAPHGICELWVGADGSSILPQSTTDGERDYEDARLTASRVVNRLQFLSLIPEEDRDGWGLERRRVTTERAVATGRESASFVLVVPDDSSGSEVEYSAA